LETPPCHELNFGLPVCHFVRVQLEFNGFIALTCGTQYGNGNFAPKCGTHCFFNLQPSTSHPWPWHTAFSLNPHRLGRDGAATLPHPGAAALPRVGAPGEPTCGAPRKRRWGRDVPRACAAGAPPPSSDGRDGAPAPVPVREERQWARGRRREKEEIGGTHRGKIVISVVGLTPLACNVDGMAHR
jgi:hypothetical protein